MIGLPVYCVRTCRQLVLDPAGVCDCDDSACVLYILVVVSKLFQTLRQNVTGFAYNVLIKVALGGTKDFVAVVSAQCDKHHKQYSQHSAAHDIG